MTSRLWDGRVQYSTRHAKNSKSLVISRLKRVFAKSHKMITVRQALDSVLYITDWAWGGSEIVSVGQVRSDHMRAGSCPPAGQACCTGCPELLVQATQAQQPALTQPALTPPQQASQARIMRAGAYTCGRDAPCHCRCVLIGPVVHASRHSMYYCHAHPCS